MVVLLVGLTASAATVPAATDVRLGVHADKTRLVIDLSERVTYSVFTLRDPYRIVIDLPDISWQAPTAAWRRAGGLIGSLRFGRFRPGQSRVVLDLAEPARVGKSFFLDNANGQGVRFVMDLEPTSSAAFLAAMVPPKPVASRVVPPVPRDKPGTGPDEPFVIVVDPGHGGIDPGAIGVGGTYEKNVTLRFAFQLRQELRKRPRYKVVLTREDDSFVPLRERVERARQAAADLFISLHADSIANSRVRGGGIYTLSERASDKEAAELAAKENQADVIAGVDLAAHDDEVATILIDLTQRETMNYSVRFAGALVPELGQHIRLRSRPHRFAGFRVLKAPDVPSVLIELGYLSNREDERMLQSSRWRATIAASLARAIDRYVAGLES